MSQLKVEPDPGDVKTEANKSSMEILSELFSTFDAEPPVIVKKEKKEKDSSKKSKKKKHKKDKKHRKHKKKSKKKKRSSDSSSSSSEGEIDLAQLLIKKERDKAEEKIKIEGTSLSLDIKVNINKEDVKPGKSDKKIHIKDLQISKIKKEDSRKEDGEISDSELKKKKSKHKSKEKVRKRKSRSPSKEKDKRLKQDDLRHHIRHESPHYRESHSSRKRSRSRSRDRYYEDYRHRHRSRQSPYRDDFYRPRERNRSRDRYYRSPDRDRYRSPERPRFRSPQDSRFDKKKLLEIARKNAINMMSSGCLPGAMSLGSRGQEKMIAAIKSGGKTVEELTDFCKSLSKKEELGELSSLSENDDSDNEGTFHHPFKIKDRPTSITMNIANSIPLPTKTTQERSTELRIQFPVSSGQQHRSNEEWVPVEPVKPEATKFKPGGTLSCNPLPIEAPPPEEVPPEAPPPGPQAFPPPSNDLSNIVSQRLDAMRKLQENPHDVQALTLMYKSNKEMDTWAKSKQQLGQFTGSTGAQVMSQNELNSGYQAWAKKDQFTTAAPVSGGMGMHLLQKMGWKPGEGLGKEKTGALEPLLLEVKLDKKGLVATEEQAKGKKKGTKAQPVQKNLQGKHPVSLLGEYASKHKLGAPEYVLEFECGPDHKKNFLFKVLLNGVEYKPNVASANKKEAKAVAASLALKQIGLIT